MENIKQIQDFLKTDSRFEPQPEAINKRFYFIKNGQKAAYIWFKYALGGWNIIIGKEKERHHIDSVDKLKKLLHL
jgi:hypothetical protein